MDNISHSAAGFVAGELIHRSLPPESDPEQNRARRRLLLATCVLASNFPDLDLVLTPLLPPPLGYLLHHRGHTHTILYAFPQALILFSMIWLFWPSARRLLKDKSNWNARKGFGWAMGVGFGLHILMDYLNSYGIHPFHPFDSRWFFGDMVFIIEPVFWVAFGIPMAMTIQRKWLKSVFAGFLLGMPLFFTFVGFLPWLSFAVIAVVGAALGWAQLKAGPRGTGALIAAAMTGLIFVGLQSYASGVGKRTVAMRVAEKDLSSRFLGSAMTPFPANPLCWMFISIESNESAGTYRMRRGVLSLVPNLLQADECPARLTQPDNGFQDTTAEMVFLSEETNDLRLIRKLKEENCHFEAWMRFARAPSVNEVGATDIRFSRRGQRGDFTEMKFEDFRDKECSKFVPQWDFPRRDLLGPAADSSGAH